jgi:hypothetical protein
LLGSARHLPDELFEGVPISSRETLAHLTDNLHRLRRTRDFEFRTLGAWRDVDDEADLEMLLERLQATPEAAPRCRAILESHGLL